MIVERRGMLVDVTVIEYAKPEPEPVKPIALSESDPELTEIVPEVKTKTKTKTRTKVATETVRRTVEIRSEIDSILIQAADQAIVRNPEKIGPTPDTAEPCKCESPGE